MSENVPPANDQIYAALVAELLKRVPTFMSEWTSHSESDPGRTLIEIFALFAEAFMTCADELPDRVFLDFAMLFGIVPRPAVPAEVKLRFQLDADVEPGFVVDPGVQVSTNDGQIIFETVEPIVARSRRYVRAVEGSWVADEFLGVSNGQAGQSFSLRHGPILKSVRDTTNGLSYSPEIKLSAHELGRRHLWVPVPCLQFSLSKARHYVLDPKSGAIQFGDGQNGRVPSKGAKITATYRTGGGADGNLAARRLTQLVEPLPEIVAVTNSAASRGGADEENIESVRKRAPAELKHRNRAISCADPEQRSH